MPKPRKSKSRALPIIWIGAFSIVFACFVPSVVLAARDNNAFILSIAIPAMVILLVLDGIALAVMHKTKAVSSDR
jgi:hypothetical protein